MFPPLYAFTTSVYIFCQFKVLNRFQEPESNKQSLQDSTSSNIARKPILNAKLFQTSFSREGKKAFVSGFNIESRIGQQFFWGFVGTSPIR